MKKKNIYRLVSIATSITSSIGLLLRGMASLRTARAKTQAQSNAIPYDQRLKKKLEYERASAQLKEECYLRIKEIDLKYANKQVDSYVKAEYSVHSPSDFLSDEYKKRPMVGLLIPEGFDAIIYGPKNVMKSYLVMGTLIQIAQGEKPKILSKQERDSYSTPENVYCIYFDGENGGTVYNDRYSSLGNSLDGKLEIIQSETFGNGSEDFFECLTNRCQRLPDGTSIVVGVDNIKSLLNDLSQNDGKAFLNGLRRLRITLKKRGISLTTMTVCHTEKTGDKIYGSYNTQCLAPFVLRVSEGDDYDHFVLTIENSRTSLKGQARNLVVRKDEYKYLEYEDPDTAQKPTEEDPILAEARAMKAYKDAGHTQEQTADKFGCSRGTFINRMELLKKLGEM